VSRRNKNRTGGQPGKGQRFPAEPSEQARRSPLFPGQSGLKLLVFSAGAALMALEIAGSRVLAPSFGNSVFVWGSLISVFLIALSLGYFLGGLLADRHPSQALLNSICVLVSLL
jgi:predicted membrane-bound spermidine synthase